MIRPARPEDVPTILALIRELAEYERAASDVVASEASVHAALFGPRPAVFAHLAEQDADQADAGEVVGLALWFRNFSTWRGTHGIYLEDLYVRPAARGHGHGRALLTQLARICVSEGYSRLEWSVLEWNEPAISFYRSLGAAPMMEWRTFRLSGPALHGLGETIGAVSS